MNKFISIAFLLSVSVPSLSLAQVQAPASTQAQKSIEDRAAAFMQAHLKDLKPEEIQLFANVLHFTHTAAIADIELRKAMTSIFETTWTLRQATMSYEDCDILKLKQVKNTLADLDSKITSHQDLYKTLQVVRGTLDKLDEKLLIIQVVEAFNAEMQNEIRAFAANTASTFDGILTPCASVLQDAGQTLYSIGESFKELHENKIASEESAEDKDLEKISRGCSANSLLEKCCWNTHLVASSLAGYETSMQEECAKSFEVYYKALSSYMKTKINSNFTSIVFSAEGIIPMEKRTKKLPTL